MTDKIEEQVAAIPAEVGEVCDPYDGEQEAYLREEKTLSEVTEFTMPITVGDVDHGFQTQDNLVYFLDMLIKQYLVLRVKYHCGIKDADKLNIKDKLSETFRKAITLNSLVTEENIDTLLEDVCNKITNDLEFTVEFFTELASMILDRTIDVSDTAVTIDLNRSYKSEYIQQLKESALPNIMEDVRIYFNSPKIDNDFLQDLLDIIVEEQPDAIKYRIVKTSTEGDVETYKFILSSALGEFLPLYYKLKLEIKNEQHVEHSLVSFACSNDDITALLNLYLDIDRWSLLIEK